MSADLKLAADDLHKLGYFLAAITKATKDHGVRLGAYDRVHVEVTPEVVLAVNWDNDRSEYVVDDRIGS